MFHASDAKCFLLAKLIRTKNILRFRRAGNMFQAKIKLVTSWKPKMFWEYFANILLPLKKKAFVGNARLNRETFISAAMFPALVRSGYFVQAEQWRGAWWCAWADSREQSVFSFYSYSYVVYPLTTPSNNDCWWSTLFSVSRSFHSPLEREVCHWSRNIPS